MDANVVAEEELRDMRENIENLQRTVEQQRLRAQRGALLAEAGSGAAGERREEAAARDAASTTTVPTPGQGARTGTSHVSLSRPSLTQSRPPKFDNVEAHFGMWRSKCQAYLSSLGCLHALKSTASPVMGRRHEHVSGGVGAEAHASRD